MTFRNVQPLHILWQEGITPEMLQGVFCGVVRILLFAGVFHEFRFKLRHLGQRRQFNWYDQNGALNQYQSFDWYLDIANFYSQNAGHLNSLVLLDSLKISETKKVEPRYQLIVVNQPIHFSSDSSRIINGVARKDHGAVITLQPYLHFLQPVNGETDEDKKKRKFDYFIGTEMLALHELGHVLDLYSDGTKSLDPTDEELKKTHCGKDCVMYWQTDAAMYRRIEANPFCPKCLKKLKKFFIESE